MLVCALLFPLVVSALGQALRNPDAVCCSPDQWEGTEFSVGGSVVNGKGLPFSGTNTVSYDAENGRISILSNTTVNGENSVRRIIELYQQGVSYTVNLVTGSCERTLLDSDFDRGCIPGSAVPLGEFHYGEGAESLRALGFVFQRQQQKVFASVSAEGCLPVSTTFLHTQADQEAFVDHVDLVDITRGIRDVSVFEPPSSCPQE